MMRSTHLATPATRNDAIGSKRGERQTQQDAQEKQTGSRGGGTRDQQESTGNGLEGIAVLYAVHRPDAHLGARFEV